MGISFNQTEWINKMSLRSQYQTDNTKEIEGAKVEFSENSDGTIPTFYIARAGRSNRKYVSFLEKASAPHRHLMENKNASSSEKTQKIAESIMLDTFVNTLLKGWENVKLADVTGNDKDTGDAEFSIENAKILLTSLPDLYDELQAKASSIETFKNQSFDTDIKN